jgi:hypothetical protein
MRLNIPPKVKSGWGGGDFLVTERKEVPLVVRVTKMQMDADFFETIVPINRLTRRHATGNHIFITHSRHKLNLSAYDSSGLFVSVCCLETLPIADCV